MKPVLAGLGCLMFFALAGCSDDSALENAVEEMGEGVEETAEALDPNRTAGEEMGDAIEDTGEEIQDAAN
jgi:Flp pilus assembly protein TadB